MVVARLPELVLLYLQVVVVSYPRVALWLLELLLQVRVLQYQALLQRVLPVWVQPQAEPYSIPV